MELSPELVFVIGIVASVVVWILKFLQKKGTEISSGWLTAGVYVASGLLALAFAAPILPPLPPFVDLASFIPALLVWLGDLLVPLSAFVGFATLVYNVLLKKILDGMGARIRKSAG